MAIAGTLIDGFVHFAVFVEECEAEVAVLLFEKTDWKIVATTKELVKLGIAETNFGVVFEGAAIIHFVDIGPEDSSETHWTRLAGGVELAAR